MGTPSSGGEVLTYEVSSSSTLMGVARGTGHRIGETAPPSWPLRRRAGKAYCATRVEGSAAAPVRVVVGAFPIGCWERRAGGRSSRCRPMLLWKEPLPQASLCCRKRSIHSRPSAGDKLGERRTLAQGLLHALLGRERRIDQSIDGPPPVEAGKVPRAQGALPAGKRTAREDVRLLEHHQSLPLFCFDLAIEAKSE